MAEMIFGAFAMLVFLVTALVVLSAMNRRGDN